MRDPGFEIVRNRIMTLKNNSHTQLITGSKEDFDFNKGVYLAYCKVLFLMESPKNIADDGVQKLGGQTET